MVDRLFIARICRILKIMVPRALCKEVSIALSNKDKWAFLELFSLVIYLARIGQNCSAYFKMAKKHVSIKSYIRFQLLEC